MQAQEKTLIEFLRDKQQFTIPIYQRTYSWTPKQCLRLWEDIKEISENDEELREDFLINKHGKGELRYH